MRWPGRRLSGEGTVIVLIGRFRALVLPGNCKSPSLERETARDVPAIRLRGVPRLASGSLLERGQCEGSRRYSRSSVLAERVVPLDLEIGPAGTPV